MMQHQEPPQKWIFVHPPVHILKGWMLISTSLMMTHFPREEEKPLIGLRVPSRLSISNHLCPIYSP